MIVPDWVKESFVIIISLGGLELFLWWKDDKELREQTSILEEIAISLSVKETDEPSKRT